MRGDTGEVDEKVDLDAAQDAAANIEPAPACAGGTGEASDKNDVGIAQNAALNPTLPLGFTLGMQGADHMLTLSPLLATTLGDIMDPFKMPLGSWSLS